MPDYGTRSLLLEYVKATPFKTRAMMNESCFVFNGSLFHGAGQTRDFALKRDGLIKKKMISCISETADRFTFDFVN